MGNFIQGQKNHTKLYDTFGSSLETTENSLGFGFCFVFSFFPPGRLSWSTVINSCLIRNIQEPGEIFVQFG